jgi:iron complex outermembrane recepter protein
MSHKSIDAKKRSTVRSMLAVTACGVAGFRTSLALAQSAQPLALEEVVVTAERQGAQSVQNAPIAVSVINTESLERQGGSSFHDYLGSLPSVALDETGPGQNKFNIRGLSTDSFNQTDTQDRTLVSVYLDDTPISIQGNTPDLSVLDLERVEVVRGPQGTLYGAGAMAGNIRMVTVKPNLNTFSGSVDSTLTNTSGGTVGYSTRGVGNIPLIDNELALRASVYHVQESGYIDNLGTGEDHANGDRKTQARAALRFEPNSQLTLDGSFTYADLRTGGLNDTLSALGFNYSSNIPESYHDNLKISNVTLNYDLGGANLTSSTSFIERQFGLLYSWQYALHRYVYKSLTDAQTQSIIAPDDIGNKLQDFDEEVKINSTGKGPFHWIAGLYFQHEARDYLQDIVNPGLDAVEGPGYSAQELGAPTPDDAYHGTQNVSEKNRAVFGELKYELLPRLTATVGLRYFNWTQDFNLYQAGLLGAIYPAHGSPVPLTSQGNAHETGTNPRYNLAYAVNDTMTVFAEAAKGFRYGGVNYPLPNTCTDFGQSPTTFQPDHLWSYQVGEKSQFFDSRMTINATAFLIDWSNVQTRKIDTSCSYFYIVSGGKVRSQGVELETSTKVTHALTLSINASYTDATADGPLPNIGALDGQRSPYTPEIIASAGLNYALQLGNNQLEFATNWRYRSDEHTDFNPTTPATFILPSSSQANASITYVAASYEVGLFGRNIFNEKEILDEGTNYNKLPLITNYGDKIYYGRTATYGIRAAFKF